MTTIVSGRARSLEKIQELSPLGMLVVGVAAITSCQIPLPTPPMYPAVVSCGQPL